MFLLSATPFIDPFMQIRITFFDILSLTAGQSQRVINNKNTSLHGILIAHKRISLFGYNEEVDKHRQIGTD